MRAREEENDVEYDNYLVKLERLYAEGKTPQTPGLWHALVEHEDWCASNRDMPCNCDPDISFVDHATWSARGN
jgi:hypothetical protein